MKIYSRALAALLVCLALPAAALAQQDIPLTVVVEGTPGSPGGLRIVSDGLRRPSGENAGSYTNGQDGVYAVLLASGMFILDPTDKSAKTRRYLWYDFSLQIDRGTISNPWLGKGLTAIDSRVQIGDMYGVPLTSDTDTARPPYVLRKGVFQQMFSGNSKTNYRIAFRPTIGPGESPDGFTSEGNPLENYPYVASPYEVRHPDCNTWVITPRPVSSPPFDLSGRPISNPGAIATLIGFNTTTNSAGQYQMPFEITLKRVTPVTTCQ